MEKPGAAYAYNDWQMALFWDTLFLKVYGAAYANVTAEVVGLVIGLAAGTAGPLTGDHFRGLPACARDRIWQWASDRRLGMLSANQLLAVPFASAQIEQPEACEVPHRNADATRPIASA